LQKARSCLEQALALRPQYPEALNNLGSVWRLMGHDELAIEHFRKTLAIAPQFASAHYNLGKLLEARGERTLSEFHMAEFQRLQSDVRQRETPPQKN
jgi:tetratricopeptide (TPR) repeat protein